MFLIQPVYIFYLLLSQVTLYEAGETHQELKRNTRAIKNRSNDLCPGHLSLEDKIITYECDDHENNLKSCNVNGSYSRFTVAKMKCKPNYSVLEGAYFRSICYENSWVPEIDNCYKQCEPLNPVNVDLKCYRKGKEISCDEGVLLAGTRVRPTCKILHTYRNFIPTYREIVCRYDGKWDNMLFSCVPECGKVYKSATKLIRGGKEETGDSPWHVAIYNRDKILICGGTIIHSYLVISAAHCFHTDGNERQSAEDFEVVVSKFTRTYNKIDNENQKIFKIREIRLPTKGYFGLNNYFAADIAILILAERITISPTVLPACVDWNGLNSNEYPPDGTTGKVAGWGQNEIGDYTEKLQTADLPIINRNSCVNTVPNNFKAYITYDKFCAGSHDGPSVLQGDSGGGLMLKENGLYFLRGVVSLKQPTSTAIAAFTDIADHVDWIIATRDEIEKEILEKEINEQKIADRQKALIKTCDNYDNMQCTPFQNCSSGRDLVQSRKAVLCGFSGKNMPKLCCPIPANSVYPQFEHSTPLPQPLNPSLPGDFVYVSTTSSAELTTSNTEGPAASPQPEIYRDYPLLWDAINSTGDPNKPISECEIMALFDLDGKTNCNNVSVSKKEATIALPKELPHMALIGYGNTFKDVEWLCSGSLINLFFVLSSARCRYTALGEPKWVMLGELNITSTKDDAMPAVYKIISIHQSNKASDYENLALFQLNTTVLTNEYVKPACLQAPTRIPIKTKGIISGWGWRTKGTEDRSNEHLLKAAVTVIADEQCKNLYDNNDTSNFGDKLQNGYQSETMLCVGNSTEGEALCANVDGSPLQIHMEDYTCPWTIIAISSFGHTSCGISAENANPYIFIQVSSHVDWIHDVTAGLY